MYRFDGRLAEEWERVPLHSPIRLPPLYALRQHYEELRLLMAQIAVQPLAILILSSYSYRLAACQWMIWCRWTSSECTPRLNQLVQECPGPYHVPLCMRLTYRCGDMLAPLTSKPCIRATEATAHACHQVAFTFLGSTPRAPLYLQLVNPLSLNHVHFCPGWCNRSAAA